MNERITEKQLRSLVAYINDITGSPQEPYSKNSEGNFKANIGNYHLDFAYGGVNLSRMANDGGGINQPLGGGFHTKRELYDKLQAFIRGIQTGKELKS